MLKKEAIVIGAGVAGIASAIRLAVKGYQVSVFEANSYPGGKLSEFQLDGFRFDAGPSLFTMPQYVDELFQLAGLNPANYFTCQKLDVTCKYFYPDGTEIKAYAEPEKFARELQNKAGIPHASIRNFQKKSAAIYGITNHVFLEQSLHRLKTYMNRKTVGSIFKLPGIDALRSMHKANKSFFKDRRLVQFFDRYATYNGSNPYSAPATLNVIPHLEQHFGVWFPQKGMYQIISSLVHLAQTLGVKFNYNCRVEEIVLDDKKATGVKVAGNVQFADVVVSNMDVWFTYHTLLSAHPQLQPSRILNQERSSSALIFYWGINKQFAQLHVHNVFFSANYRAEFDSIWQKQDIYGDPTVYVNISSKLKPDDAPEGCENWFVMINVPANKGQDWPKLISKARTAVLNKLSVALNQDIEKLIVCEQVLDPVNIERKTSAWQGSLYGNSSNSRYAAFLRHANRSAKVKNLYFCGGSVHPGGGIPLALLSAKIVADWVE